MADFSFDPVEDIAAPAATPFSFADQGPTPAAPIVPGNAEAVASQAALATKQDPAEEYHQQLQRTVEYLQGIHNSGTGPTLYDIWRQDTDKKITAARGLAEQAALDGNSELLQSYAEQIHALTQKHSPNEAEAQQATAQQAMVKATAEAAVKHPAGERFSRRVDVQADMVASRNIFMEEIERHQAEAGTASKWSDKLLFLAENSLLAIPEHLIQGSKMEAIREGKDEPGFWGTLGYGLRHPTRILDTQSETDDFLNFLNGMHPDRRSAVLKSAIDSIDNPARREDLLRKLHGMSPGEVLTENVFSMLDLEMIGGGLKSLYSAGKFAVAVKKAGGADAAGKVIADKIKLNINTADLNNSEYVASMLSAGVGPHELAARSTNLTGMSAQLQKELIDAGAKLDAELRKALVGGNRTPEEVAQARLDLQNKWTKENDPSLYHVFFGEASQSGQELTIYRQSANGRVFLTREAAEAELKRIGLPGDEVVARPTDVPGNAERLAERGSLALDKEEAGQLAAHLDDLYKDALKASRTDPVMKSQVNDIVALKKALKREEWDKVHELSSKLGLTEQKVGQADVDAFAKAKTQTSGIWDGGKTIHFSDSVPENYRAAVQKLSSIFGTEGKRLVVVIDKDIAGIAAKHPELHNVEHGLSGGKTLAEELAHPTNNALFDGTGKDYHIIALKSGRSTGKQMQSLLHEFGHHYDYEVLMKNPELRQALREQFAKWLQDNEHLTSKEFVAKYRQAGDAVLTGNRIDHGYGKWLDDFKEFWAENFAKFATTDAVPKNALEQFFKDSVDKIKDAYKVLSEHFGFAVGKPEDFIRDYLKQRIEDVQKAADVADAVFNAGRGKAERLAEHSAMEQVPAGKPRIFPKVAPDVPPDAAGGWVIKQRRTDPYSYSSIGKHSDADINSADLIAVDPKHGASAEEVARRVVGVFAQAMIKGSFADYLKTTLGGLSRASLKRVEAVWEKGDRFSDIAGNVGKEFNYGELKGMGLEEKEIKAYFAGRTARMFTFQLRNAEMRQHLQALGFREFNYSVVTDGVGALRRVVGRNVEDLSKLEGKLVWDARTGKRVKVTEEVMQELQAGSAKMAEVYHPEKVDGQLHKYILHDEKAGNYRDLNQVLNYRPGEFSRIYTDNFFVKVIRKGVVDGAEGTYEDTIRTAASQREAEDYVRGMKSAVALLDAKVPGNMEAEVEKLIGSHTDPREFIKAHAAGEFSDIKEWDWKPSRDKSDYLNQTIGEMTSNGRSFTGTRTERIYSVVKDRANSLSPFEALQAEITNISRVMSIAEWRENAVRRWMNTFGHMFKGRSGDDVKDFFKILEESGGKLGKNTAETQFAHREMQYVARQIGIPTQLEQKLTQLQQSLTDHIFTGNEKVEWVGAKVRNADVTGFMRSTTYHATLGLFNVKQLVVQAMGMVNAAAIHPLHALASMRDFTAVRMAMMSDNPAVWKHLSTFSGMKGDEFARYIQVVKRSGIIADMRSTALHNAEDGKFNIFNSYWDKGLELGTAPFRRGEEFNRMVAFDIARREWIAKNPGKEWDSVLAVKQMVTRMDDFSQNMTRANKAAWQESVWSIPTQFLQYNIKLAQNIASSAVTAGKRGAGRVSGNTVWANTAYRGFTGSEALRIGAAQVLMYGAAGNGLLALLNGVVPDDTLENMDESTKLYLTQGIVAGVLNNLSQATTGQDMKLAIGSQLGNFNWYTKTAQAAFTEPANVYMLFGGPTAAMGKRAMPQIANIYRLWGDPAYTGADLVDSLKELGTSEIAGLRNATKGEMALALGAMVNAGGDKLAAVSANEAIAQMFGFAPAAVESVYNLREEKKDHDTTVREYAAQIYSLQQKQVYAWSKGTKAGDEQAEHINHLISALLLKKDAGFHMEVVDHIKNKLYPYDTEFQKLQGEYILKGHSYPRSVTNSENK